MPRSIVRSPMFPLGLKLPARCWNRMKIASWPACEPRGRRDSRGTPTPTKPSRFIAQLPKWRPAKRPRFRFGASSRLLNRTNMVVQTSEESIGMPAEGDPRITVVHVGKFYPPHPGGMESPLETLCRELRKTMNVRALVANDARRDEDSVVDGVRVSRLATHFNLAGAPVCATMPWKVRGAAAGIVHVHLPNPAGILAVMASGYKGKLDLTWHSDVVRQRRLAQIFAPIQRWFLSRCSAIIATSPNYLETSPDLA